MTSNQRRPGFRLPWASEAEAADAEAATTGTVEPTPTGEAVPEAAATQPAAEPVSESPDAVAEKDSSAMPAATAPEPAPQATPPATAESSSGFMRDLITAMRRVSEETRQAGLSELRTKTEEQVRTLEAEAEKRREELKARAETDVEVVGEWARTESERIKREAEQRVVARRASLDQELAAETTRAETEAGALRDRVGQYERELDAYHAQLSDIADPAAFAAAAKRMPAPPPLIGAVPAPVRAEPEPSAIPAEPTQAGANGTAPTAAIHPAEEEVLASRLAELDATLEPASADPAATPPAIESASAEPTSTEILVKGLGSFGAITGFRQALASVAGIEGVSLSLGPTGEFVFRAIHPTGFDLSAAIAKLEGDAAKIEPLADGGLRVTLDRAR